MVNPTISYIEKALTEALHPTQLIVTDDSAEHAGHANEGAGHYTVAIQSPMFEGKNTIAQHRMVYAALGTLMQTDIHALRIKVL